MARHKISELPVVDAADRPLGIIDITDLGAPWAGPPPAGPPRWHVPAETSGPAPAARSPVRRRSNHDELPT
jgi:hypothetical protein